MKPRIWKSLHRPGVWVCGLPDGSPWGHGFSAKDAFDNWEMSRLARTSEAAGLEAT